jgi:hypothetical protein
MTSIIRRYTDIPALVYLLRERVITLLDPQTWDDSNDSYYLSLYKEKKKLQCVLALCFTQVSERYHHWRVFADVSSGVCIRFLSAELLKVISNKRGVRLQAVNYLTLEESRRKNLKSQELPFTKRYPFEDEQEFRIIYESKTENTSTLNIPIPLSCIDGITLSPWIPKELVAHVRDMIRGIDGCSKIKIVRSTLVGNDEWKRIGDHAT